MKKYSAIMCDCAIVRCNSHVSMSNEIYEGVSQCRTCLHGDIIPIKVVEFIKAYLDLNKSFS